MSHPTKDQLRRAIAIQEKIEDLQKELEEILQGISSSVQGTAPKKRGRPKATKTAAKTPAKRGPKPGAKRGPKPGAKRGRKPAKKGGRTNSPSGPLAPAVTKVLQRAGKALKTREILDGLKEDNYQWTNANPMANLSARLYTMAGVERVGSGLFKLSGAESVQPQQEQ